MKAKAFSALGRRCLLLAGETKRGWRMELRKRRGREEELEEVFFPREAFRAVEVVARALPSLVEGEDGRGPMGLGVGRGRKVFSLTAPFRAASGKGVVVVEGWIVALPRWGEVWKVRFSSLFGERRYGLTAFGRQALEVVGFLSEAFSDSEKHRVPVAGDPDQETVREGDHEGE